MKPWDYHHRSPKTRLERIRVVAELTDRQRGRVFSYRRYVHELTAEQESAP